MLDCSSSFPLILVVNKCNVVHRAMLSRSVYFFALSRWYIFFEFSVLCLKNKIVFISSVWKLYWEYQNEGVGGGKPEHCPLHNDKELWVTQSCAWSRGGTMGGCWNWGKGLWVGSSEKWGWECGMGKRGREGGGDSMSWEQTSINTWRRNGERKKALCQPVARRVWSEASKTD